MELIKLIPITIIEVINWIWRIFCDLSDYIGVSEWTILIAIITLIFTAFGVKVLRKR